MGYQLSIAPGTPVLVTAGDQTIALPEYAGASAGVTIIATQPEEMVAPHGVWLEAMMTGVHLPGREGDGVYDPHFHELLYQWEVLGETGTVQRANFRGPAEWQALDRFEGPFAFHVFGQPGTYTVRCTVRNRVGIVAQNDMPVTVADPAAYFPGGQTICVAKDGNFEGAPAGAQQAANLMAAIGLLGGTADAKKRILLKRGESHFEAGRINVSMSGLPNFYLGAFGEGADPRITGFASSGHSARGLVVTGLSLEGAWDPTTETGLATGEMDGDDEPVGDGGTSISLGAGGHRVVVYDCRSKGHSISVQIKTDNAGFMFVAMNVHISDWRDYGILGTRPVGRFGLRGVSIQQNPLARGGGMGKGTGHNTHGPMRWSPKVGDTSQLFIGQTDMFSNTGWSQNSGRPAWQAAFRTGGGDGGARIIFNRIVMEGTLNLTRTAASYSGKITRTNILVDKAYLIGTTAAMRPLATEFGCYTGRNMVLVTTNAVPYYNGTPSAGTLLTAIASPDDARNGEGPVGFYSSTIISHRAAPQAMPANAQLVRVSRDTARKAVGNNVLHAPGHTWPLNEGPLGAEVLFAPLATSAQWVDEPEPDTSYATPPGSAILPVPLPGAPAIGSADPLTSIAVDDFFGRLRPLIGASRGAFEPVLD